MWCRVIGTTVHYEVMGLRGRSWTIVQVAQAREPAVTAAMALWDSRSYEGVRVVKEIFHKQSREFQSVEIFSRGKSTSNKRQAERENIAPCLSPDDIYSRDGRQAIWRMMHRTLSDWGLTPTELLHVLKHYYKLNNTGTLLQDALQRTAISFDIESDSIQLRTRKLQKLIDQCVDILKAEKGRVVPLEVGRLKPLIEKIESRSNHRFMLLSSLSHYLLDAATPEDKLGRLVVFLSSKYDSWVLEGLDQMISEVIQITRVIPRLIGDVESHGEYLNILMHFAVGQVTVVEHGDGKRPAYSEDMLRLNSFIAEGYLPDTVRVIAERLAHEVVEVKPISDGNITEQLHLLQDMVDKLSELDLAIGHRDTVRQKIVERSARAINSQNVADLINPLEDPFDKVQALLDLIHVTMGDANRRTIANFIMPILSRPDHEARLLGIKGQPVMTMKALTRLQTLVLTAPMSQNQKAKVAEKLDQLCRSILETTQILEKVAGQQRSEVQKATQILQMLVEQTFTHGDCRSRAEDSVRVMMRQPHFTRDLIESSSKQDSAQALLHFKDLIDQAGLGQKGKTDTADSETSEADEDSPVSVEVEEAATKPANTPVNQSADGDIEAEEEVQSYPISL